jgi:uncharacterized glyoxalase superfamily protein PhnB
MDVTAGGPDRPDHSIWASLAYRDPQAQRAWLAGLGFVEGIALPGEAKREIHHSEMLWPEGGRVMVCSVGTREAGYDTPPGGAGLNVVTDDPDVVYARALALGAEVVRPIVDQSEYPSRDFSVRDPEGNIWTFMTYGR